MLAAAVWLMLAGVPSLDADCTTLLSETVHRESGQRLAIYQDACGLHEPFCGDNSSVTRAAIINPAGRLGETVTLAYECGFGRATYREREGSFEVSETEKDLVDDQVRSQTRTRYALVPTRSGKFERKEISSQRDAFLTGRYRDTASGESIVLDASSEDGKTFSKVNVQYTNPKEKKPRQLDVVSSSVERSEVVVRFAAKGPGSKLTVDTEWRTLTSERPDGGEVQVFRRAAK